ncbi:zinc-ribbon domain-containing protein [Paenibacillus aestuarii]|uniref:Zinc-ribbon domain-containing protein n=1 Tax=Paenibacillus aestuarii TaxID=516965 RepID=A0ABW0KFF5_9BACL|nr:zinc-ribbon domain-containing protein [Paenibacillus aestuarii]
MAIAIGTSIGEKFPILIKEWHLTKNGDHTPYNTGCGSEKKIWWLCEKGHEWSATPYNRTKGKTGCPYCSGRRATLENCLETKNKELSAEWHPSKNGTLSPRNVVSGTKRKFWWKCEKGHEWEASVWNRAKPKNATGCPRCSGYILTEEKSLANSKPELAKEWHPIKNGSETQNDVFIGSSKKVWWLCQNGHEWQAIISSRSKKNGNGCPYCSGQLASPEYCLAVSKPNLAKQWHPTKNGTLTPYDVTPGSGKAVWWICKKGHERKVAVNSCSDKDDICPICSAENKTSFMEQALYFYIKRVFANASNREIIEFMGKKSEADIFIPELNLAIEYDGFHHKKSGNIKKDERKNRFFYLNGIRLIRIRGADFPDLQAFGSSVITQYSNKEEEITSVVQEIFQFIRSEFVLSQTTIKEMIKQRDAQLDADRGNILEQYILSVKERNLSEANPDIAKEWHPTKNGSLLPENVFLNSIKKVWWICEKGHEWPSTINHRTNNGKRKGTGCPFCANKKVNAENSLALTNPELANQWHPTKNKEKPTEVFEESNKKAWWLCKKGHEWYTSPNLRKGGRNGCPICSNRIITMETSLGAVNPKLAKEWHPIKNGEMTPFDVPPVGAKKVWWLCEKGHEWQSRIANRSYGNGCKQCDLERRKNRKKETT